MCQTAQFARVTPESVLGRQRGPKRTGGAVITLRTQILESHTVRIPGGSSLFLAGLAVAGQQGSLRVLDAA